MLTSLVPFEVVKNSVESAHGFLTAKQVQVYGKLPPCRALGRSWER